MEPAANTPLTTSEDSAPAAQSPGTVPPVPQLELITRSGCHLCEDARAVVIEVAGDLGLPWSEVRIDGNAELAARYGEEIPVVLVDGVQRDFWHIDPVRLRSILSQAMTTGRPAG